MPANTETQSSVRHAGTTPVTGTRPRVGLTPTRPCSAAGTRPDPAVSVPRARSAIPSATATAEPLLDPPEMRSGAVACRTAPYGLRVPTRPVANWSRFVVPSTTAPASRSRATAVASAGAGPSANEGHPAVVGGPATAMLPLGAVGVPVAQLESATFDWVRDVDADAVRGCVGTHLGVTTLPDDERARPRGPAHPPREISRVGLRWVPHRRLDQVGGGLGHAVCDYEDSAECTGTPQRPPGCAEGHLPATGLSQQVLSPPAQRLRVSGARARATGGMSVRFSVQGECGRLSRCARCRREDLAAQARRRARLWPGVRTVP